MVDFLNNCEDLYGPHYKKPAKWSAEEEQVPMKMFSFKEPGFLYFTAGLGAIYGSIFLWCFFNQNLTRKRLMILDT